MQDITIESSTQGNLHVYDLTDSTPVMKSWSSGDIAERLFRKLLSLYKQEVKKIEVDVRLPNMQDAIFFGKTPTPLRCDAIDQICQKRMAGNGTPPETRVITTVVAPTVDAVINEVVRDVGWFSSGAFGIVINGELLIDKMYDGCYLQAICSYPLEVPIM